MSKNHVVLEYTREFGGFIRSVRMARGFTQEQLAERADVAADTIRRLERTGISPTLDTLTKISLAGLDLRPSTLFVAYELADPHLAMLSIFDRLSCKERRTLEPILRVLLEFVESSPTEQPAMESSL